MKAKAQSFNPYSNGSVVTTSISTSGVQYCLDSCPCLGGLASTVTFCIYLSAVLLIRKELVVFASDQPFPSLESYRGDRPLIIPNCSDKKGAEDLQTLKLAPICTSIACKLGRLERLEPMRGVAQTRQFQWQICNRNLSQLQINLSLCAQSMFQLNLSSLSTSFYCLGEEILEALFVSYRCLYRHSRPLQLKHEDE